MLVGEKQLAFVIGAPEVVRCRPFGQSPPARAVPAYLRDPAITMEHGGEPCWPPALRTARGKRWTKRWRIFRTLHCPTRLSYLRRQWRSPRSWPEGRRSWKSLRLNTKCYRSAAIR